MGDSAVIDLSSLAFYSKAWNGFSEDKCYVSIEVTRYHDATQGRYIVKNIDNYDFSGEYLNYAAPTLTVDYDAENVAEGVKNLDYRLFDAKATDLFANDVKVEKNVYFNYGTSKQIEIDVKDNKFTPLVAGEYALVYRARDGFDNMSEVVIPVNVTASASPFGISVAEMSEACYTGVPLELMPPVYTGNRGEVIIDELTVKEKNGTAECVVSDGKFVASKAGVYVVSYSVHDYLNRTATFAYELEVEANEKPLFDGELNLLPVYSVGKSYTLPKLNGYDYSGGIEGELTDTTITVTYADGHTVVLSANDEFVPEREHGNKISIQYKIESAAGLTNVLHGDALLADYDMTRGNIEQQKYFAVSNVNVIAQDMELRAEVVDNASPAYFAFAKPLLTDSLVLRMRINAESNSFNALKLTLRDAEDPTIRVCLTVEKNAQKSKLYINESEKAYQMAGSFWGSDAELGSQYDIQLYYNNKTRQLLDATQTSVAGITTDMNGDVFEGFPSKRAYVTFEFEGVEEEGTAAIEMYQFNTQPLSNVMLDTTKPELYVAGDYGGLADFGTVFTLPIAYAEDVLSTVQSISVSVINPNNLTVISEEGTPLNRADATRQYTVKFDMSGTYKITYYSTDSNGNEMSATTKLVYVLQKVEPIFTLSGEVPTTGKQSQTITVPDVLIADGDELNYYIILLDPNFTQYLLYSSVKPVEDATLSFEVKVKGTYVLRYYVFDKLYNYVMSDYEIIIE